MKFITITVIEHDTDKNTSEVIIEQIQPANLLVACTDGKLNEYGAYDTCAVVSGEYNVLVRMLNALAAKTHNAFITKVEEQKDERSKEE